MPSRGQRSGCHSPACGLLVGLVGSVPPLGFPAAHVVPELDDGAVVVGGVQIGVEVAATLDALDSEVSFRDCRELPGLVFPVFHVVPQLYLGAVAADGVEVGVEVAAAVGALEPEVSVGGLLDVPRLVGGVLIAGPQLY